MATLRVEDDLRARMLDVVQAIRADIRMDVSRRDGQEFSARNVAVAMAEICAQVDALAHMMETILDRDRWVDDG